MATYAKFYKTFVDKKDELTKAVFANTPEETDTVVDVKFVGNETYAVTVEASTPEVLTLARETWPVVEKPYLSLTIRQATASTPYQTSEAGAIAEADFVHVAWGAAYGLKYGAKGHTATLKAEFAEDVPFMNKVGDTVKIIVTLTVDATEGFEDNKIVFNGLPMVGEVKDKVMTLVVDVPVVKPTKTNA